MPNSPYYGTALDAAQQYGVPTNLFLAQIGQESSWNPNAQNGNAIGIAQFMPTTASNLGVNPYDPTSSLYGAAKYDAQLYSQYGSWQTAMEKYGTTANGNGPQVALEAMAADNRNGNFLQRNIQGISDYIGAATAGANKVVGAVSDTAHGIGTLLSIVTDLPRLLSIIMGLILLGAGLYMLGVQPVVKIVEQVKEKAPSE
jgi:hypothetical protein